MTAPEIESGHEIARSLLTFLAIGALGGAGTIGATWTFLRRSLRIPMALLGTCLAVLWPFLLLPWSARQDAPLAPHVAWATTWMGAGVGLALLGGAWLLEKRSTPPPDAG